MYKINKTPFNRFLFFAFGDLILLSFSVHFSFLLRFGFDVPVNYNTTILLAILLFVPVQLLTLVYCNVYRLSWSYFGMYEMWNIVRAAVVSFFFLAAITLLLRDFDLFYRIPRSILFINFFCALFLTSGFRISKRFYLHILRGQSGPCQSKPTLVIGAGNVGEQLVRDMKRNQNATYWPVGFIDDDPQKKNLNIHGVKVYGNRDMLPELVSHLDIESVVLALPNASPKEVRGLLNCIHEAGIAEIKTVPGLNEILEGHASLTDLKEILIEDILGREQAEVDEELINKSLAGKRILITGAGGSIGSELLRQVINFCPERVVALDIDETELFYLEQELKGLVEGVRVCPVVGDVRDRVKMHWVYENHRPHVVFHAAAYKHVPIMEEYPEEAINVNIFGTRVVAELAVKFGIERFVMVSTDKAVRPTNVMGATKRVAEKIVNALNEKGVTRFVSVRFGNVVGSRGSVIPIFQEQIRSGGPVTVTHADMTRYFMSIPESVLLILQAGAMASGGEVYVLEMGDPVKIVDMAQEMIRLHGLEPDIDIPIVFSGIRPGEKMYEELLTSKEDVESTGHPKIYKAKDSSSLNNTIGHLQKLEELVLKPDPVTLRCYLKKLVPSYQPELFCK
ncbi:MAG: polysaccharide biosynthesis protein [Desulfobulbaceae bacterium]|nr:polysaccharide biosynthesis protein [Desulfobulbaceae bacterium]